MKFIIGLGNPGPKYAPTKHNIGSRVVKILAKEHRIKMDEKRYGSFLGRGSISGNGCVLVIPEVYMNSSGKAVGGLFRREIKTPDDMIVVCDDINLEIGRIRLRPKGSSGGHKGLMSIIDSLGRSDFPRLRIGIATGTHKGDITDYVLAPFKSKDSRKIGSAVAMAKEALSVWLKNGICEAMNRFNG